MIDRVYIVNGYIINEGRKHTFIDGVYEDKKRAEAYCSYVNKNIHTNLHLSVSEHPIERDDYTMYLNEKA